MEVIPDFSDAQRWDSYVEKHSQSRFCHLFAYRCIQRAYGYIPRYFAFLRGGEIVGVLPAFETASLLFGKRLVSQPYTEYGGMLLNCDVTSAEFAEIAEGLGEFLHANRLLAIEMHGRQGILSDSLGASFREENAHEYAYLSLDRPIEEIWKKVVTYQVRKALQRAERSGIRVEQKTDPGTIRNTFFPLYLHSMKRLGVPPHTIKYYLECYAAFAGRMQIFWAIRDNTPITGLLGFSCGRRVNVINIVSDERYWEERPNDLVHWEYIKWAHNQGFEYFDFGSVRYEGQRRYKQKWGCQIEPHAYYFLSGSERKEVSTFNSSSSGMKKSSDLWARYVPGSVAKAVGPFLRKQLVR